MASTRRQIIDKFERDVKPFLDPRDLAGIRSAWDTFIDDLVKDGKLDRKYAKTWGNPYRMPVTPK